MKKVALIVIILFISVFVNAQFIDNYGFRTGTGLSSQYFEFKDARLDDLSEWKENKLGFVFYVNAEKKLNKYFSIRPEIGYIQKGYKYDVSFITQDLEEINIINENIILHNLSVNISGKITPIQSKVKPYLILGLRCDYLFDYKGIEVEYQGSTHEFGENTLEEYDKFVLSGLLGLGVEFNNTFYFDIEYNPAITKNLDNSILSVKDSYVGVTVGMNLNTFFVDKKQ